MTIGDIYKQLLQNASLTAFDIRELLLHETSCSTHDELIRHLDSPWHPSALFEGRLERLVKGEPVAYIVESSVFYHYRFSLNRSVLIPRPETEELIELVLKKTQQMKKSLRVIDIGTGSGAIACTLKRLRPHWSLGASDMDGGAVEVARHNAAKMNLTMDIRLGSALQPWGRESIDGIVSNPPYILDVKTIDQSVWNYEPHHALITQQDSSLFDPLLRSFTHLPSLQFVALELFDGWQQWIEDFVHHNQINVTIEWLKDINQKVRFAWIERKRLL